MEGLPGTDSRLHSFHGDDYPPLLLRPSLYPVWTSLSARHHLPARWPCLVIARVHYHTRSTLLHSHCFVQQPFFFFLFLFFFFFLFIASRSSTLIPFVNKCACGVLDCLKSSYSPYLYTTISMIRTCLLYQSWFILGYKVRFRRSARAFFRPSVLDLFVNV